MAAPALDRDSHQPCTLTPTLHPQALGVSALPLCEATAAVASTAGRGRMLPANGAVIPGPGATAPAAKGTIGVVSPARSQMAEPIPGNQVRESTSVGACMDDNWLLLLPLCYFETYTSD
jgi:hypothetical protein